MQNATQYSGSITENKLGLLKRIKLKYNLPSFKYNKATGAGIAVIGYSIIKDEFQIRGSQFGYVTSCYTMNRQEYYNKDWSDWIKYDGYYTE